MLSVTLEGPPFERGFQHGKKFAQEIRQEIRTFCPDHWLQSKHVCKLERRLMTSLANRFPELLVEMVGISKGSAIDLERIALLNLVLATNDLGSDSISRTFKLACSAIGISDSDVGPIVAKNCDETRTAAPFYLFQTVRPEDGLAFMGIGNVGTVWLEGGMNEVGFALMQTAGPIAPEQNGHGIACNIAPRAILARCRTTGESIAMLKNMYVAGWGMGLVLVDASGDVAVVEKTGDLCAVRYGGTNALFCTNHFTDSIMRDTEQIAHEGLTENSGARYQTLKVLFEDRDWPHTLEGVKGALAYHGDAGFVCQHGDANMHSNYSCIAIVQEKKILLGDGYPCQNNHTQHLL